MNTLKYISILTAMVLLTISFSTVPTANAQDINADVSWLGQYYDNGYLGGSPALTRRDDAIAFNWGYGAPASGFGSDNFSIRWTADVFMPAATYRFYARADDDISIVIDNNVANTVIDTFETPRVGDLVSGDITLSEGVHTIQVNYREVTQTAYAFVSFENIDDGIDGANFSDPTDVPVTGQTWFATYYPNTNLTGTPIATEAVYDLDINWGAGSPLPAVPNDSWSARYTTTQTLGGGTYRLRVDADDGVRVYIDDVLYIDEWHEATRETYTRDVSLAAGAHDFVVEYYEDAFNAYLQYTFSRLSSDRNVPDGGTQLEQVTITDSPLVLRDSPDPVNGGVLGIIYAGNSFYLTGQQTNDGWLQARYNGTYGWVNGNEANIVQPPAQNVPVGTDASLVAPTYTVNIRQGPGTNFRDIGNLPPDRAVDVVGRNASGTWFEVNYNGISGWVTSQYTRLQPGATLNEIPITDA